MWSQCIFRAEIPDKSIMGANSTTARPDEDELKLGLIGSAEEQEVAFTALFRHYHRRILAFIERRHPGLPSDMAADAMVETFRALHTAVQRGTFDVDRPLEPYLFTVATRKAVDQLRKLKRQLPSAPNRAEGDDAFQDIAAALSGTETGTDWGIVVSQAAANEIAKIFREFLLTLPPVQRQAAQIVADNFPASLQYREICDEILRRTGERPTSIQVKSALNQIRQKFASLIKQRKR